MLGAAGLLTVGCRSPWDVIRPAIQAKDQDRIAAMKSAPMIVVAEVEDTNVFARPRSVQKPMEIGGPIASNIPLHLAQVSAKVLLTLRGSEVSRMQFYSWVWASGKHGGPRLFSPSPGSVHTLFLKEDSSYLHTVGDYPAYDVEIRSQWVPAFLASWKAGYAQGAELIERIVAVRLKAELESIPTGRGEYWLDTEELAELTSQSFIASQLDSLCHVLTNPVGRVKACAALAERNRATRN